MSYIWGIHNIIQAPSFYLRTPNVTLRPPLPPSPERLTSRVPSPLSPPIPPELWLRHFLEPLKLI